MTKVAVTGGSGFVGAALIDLLLEQGCEVVALARDPKRLKQAAEVEIVAGGLDDAEALQKLTQRADFFLHLAGVTHARRDADYHSVNVEGARKAAAAAARDYVKFIHISSMSARMPDISPYARSKFDSEAAVHRASGDNPWIALRLPAIYGPGDRATLPYFRLIKSGWAPEPRTPTPARASILFVADAAEAIIAAQDAPVGAVYEVGDDRAQGYAWSEIGAVLGEVVGKRPRALRVPRAAIAALHGVAHAVETALGKAPSIRSGQVDEFFHPDWVARDNLFSAATRWRAKTSLHEGFAKTVRWYQEQGLL